jgi:hypothetical protein
MVRSIFRDKYFPIEHFFFFQVLKIVNLNVVEKEKNQITNDGKSSIKKKVKLIENFAFRYFKYQIKNMFFYFID